MPATTALHDVNPDHHLWRNGRFWWVAFTLIHDGWRQERVRRSLGTANLDEARRHRDELLEQYARLPGAEVAALRLRGDETTPFRIDLEARREPEFASA